MKTEIKCRSRRVVLVIMLSIIIMHVNNQYLVTNEPTESVVGHEINNLINSQQNGFEPFFLTYIQREGLSQAYFNISHPELIFGKGLDYSLGGLFCAPGYYTDPPDKRLNVTEYRMFSMTFDSINNTSVLGRIATTQIVNFTYVNDTHNYDVCRAFFSPQINMTEMLFAWPQNTSASYWLSIANSLNNTIHEVTGSGIRSFWDSNAFRLIIVQEFNDNNTGQFGLINRTINPQLGTLEKLQISGNFFLNNQSNKWLQDNDSILTFMELNAAHIQTDDWNILLTTEYTRWFIMETTTNTVTLTNTNNILEGDSTPLPPIVIFTFIAILISAITIMARKYLPIGKRQKTTK